MRQDGKRVKTLADKRRENQRPTSGQRRSLRKRVFLRDRGICWICGKPVIWNAPNNPLNPSDDEYTLDHVVPFIYGGKWSMSNLRVAHRKCNRERGHDCQLLFDF